MYFSITVWKMPVIPVLDDICCIWGTSIEAYFDCIVNSGGGDSPTKNIKIAIDTDLRYETYVGVRQITSDGSGLAFIGWLIARAAAPKLPPSPFSQPRNASPEPSDVIGLRGSKL